MYDLCKSFSKFDAVYCFCFLCLQCIFLLHVHCEIVDIFICLYFLVLQYIYSIALTHHTEHLFTATYCTLKKPFVSSASVLTHCD